jgi:hypothetical protein
MVEAERDPTSMGCKFKHVITCQRKHVHTSSYVLERELNSRLNLNDPRIWVRPNSSGDNSCQKILFECPCKKFSLIQLKMLPLSSLNTSVPFNKRVNAHDTCETLNVCLSPAKTAHTTIHSWNTAAAFLLKVLKRQTSKVLPSDSHQQLLDQLHNPVSII